MTDTRPLAPRQPTLLDNQVQANTLTLPIKNSEDLPWECAWEYFPDAGYWRDTGALMYHSIRSKGILIIYENCCHFIVKPEQEFIDFAGDAEAFVRHHRAEIPDCPPPEPLAVQTLKQLQILPPFVWQNPWTPGSTPRRMYL